MVKLYPKYFALAFFLSISILFSFAQKVDIEWEYDFENQKSNSTNLLMQTKDGGYIVGGTMVTKVNLNPNIDVYYTAYQVIKLNIEGEEEWSRTFGGERNDEIGQIIETDDGGYLVGGTSDSYSSGNKTVGTFGVLDIWILKLDKVGNVEWQQSYGGLSQDLFSDFVETDDGYLVGGSSRSINNGNKTAHRISRHDYWIIKIDKLGEIIWDKTYGADYEDLLTNITISSDGNYFLSGSSNSKKNGTKSQESRGGSDYWIIKIDKDGNVIWDKSLGGYNKDFPVNAFVSKDGMLFIEGYSKLWSE